MSSELIPNYRLFRNRLIYLRISRGLTKTELAREVGIPWETYRKYENFYSQPNSQNLRKLADYFEVSLAYLTVQTTEESMICLALDDWLADNANLNVSTGMYLLNYDKIKSLSEYISQRLRSGV